MSHRVPYSLWLLRDNGRTPSGTRGGERGAPERAGLAFHSREEQRVRLAAIERKMEELGPPLIQLMEVWRHSTSEISNGFAAQSALSQERYADEP